jgi:hypothetical protein
MSVWFIRPKLREMLIRGDEPNWLRNHKRRDYILAACLSAPPWVRQSDFRTLIEERNFKRFSTGVPHVIDHVIPVTCDLVCGLTVPWNMRVIDAKLNARKSNKLHLAFQAEMFDQPEQLRLLS